MQVTLLYGIFAELDIITRAVQITNRGQEAVHIEKAASAVLDFMTGEFDVIHFHGRHGMERILERTPVEHGNQVFGLSLIHILQTASIQRELKQSQRAAKRILLYMRNGRK